MWYNYSSDIPFSFFVVTIALFFYEFFCKYFSNLVGSTDKSSLLMDKMCMARKLSN